MTSPQSDPTAGRAATEQELLARLGLTRDANTQDIESTYDDIVKFLQSAPGDLRAWAQREIAAADEAYALLSDPTAEIPAGSVIVATAPAAPEAVTPVAAVAMPAAAVAEVATDDEEEEILADEPVPTRPVRKKAPPAAVAATAAATTAPDAVTIPRGLLTRIAVVAAGLVGVAVLVVAVYNFGGGGSGVPGFNGTPAPESSAAAGGVDQAQVGALMQTLQKNPNDVATLLQLANIYYQGQDFATAGTFFDKVLAVDAKNVDALLGRGATAYNSNDRTLAEKDWNAAIAIDPKNVDAHYYLGFMYLDSATPDMAKVRAEWNKVIALAPDSDIAKTVQQHLTSLASSGVGVGGSAAPSPSVAPAATPAPVASPSASTAP